MTNWTQQAKYLFWFSFGLVVGIVLAAALTFPTANKAIADHQKAIDTLHQIADAWQSRAEKCEVKERYATVIYEYRPGTSIPVLHGAFSINLGSEGNHPPADLKPVWVIPVQTAVYTNMEGASYEWIDKNGASIGRFPAVPPPPTK